MATVHTSPMKLSKCPIFQQYPLFRVAQLQPYFFSFSGLLRDWCFQWSLRRVDSQSSWKSVRQADECWCTRGRVWKDNALFDITNCFVLAIKCSLKQVSDLVRDERGLRVTHWNLFLALATYYEIHFFFQSKTHRQSWWYGNYQLSVYTERSLSVRCHLPMWQSSKYILLNVLIIWWCFFQNSSENENKWIFMENNWKYLFILLFPQNIFKINFLAILKYCCWFGQGDYNPLSRTVW